MSVVQRERGVIRRMMREGRYVRTRHTLGELIADDLQVQDIERIVMNGAIIRVEADR